MMTEPTKLKRGRGRPPQHVMPDPIPDTPENIARACMQGRPKREWDYLKPGSAAKVELKPKRAGG